MIFLFVVPIVLIYLVIFLYPTIRTGYMSFFKMSSLSGSSDTWIFKGVSNYLELLKNPLFLQSYANIMKILFIGGVATFTIALYFATVLKNMRCMKLWRAVVYLPNIITPVALVVMWTQYIFNNQFGLFKSLFTFLHMDKLANIPWTSNEMAFTSMLIAFCFGSVGYYMVMFMAAIDQIPQDYYEYANIAGANKMKTFFYVTLPLLKDTIKTAVTFWSAGAINFFLWSRVFSTNPKEPSTLVPASYMFSLVFGGSSSNIASGELKVGAGAAIGVVLTLSIVIMYGIITLTFGKDKYEY